MDSAVVLVVCLFVRPGREAAFREFEAEAARVMRRYGGRIDKVTVRSSGQEKITSRTRFTSSRSRA